VPGDPERLARAERLGAGIPLDRTTWEELLTAGEAMGVTRAQAGAIADPMPD
jgi:LDH2 family malate/lactate/ureidoglycolate dehydrogenase